MRHSLEYFLREAERCVPHLAPAERRKWAEECHAQHPGVTEEHKTGAGPLPAQRAPRHGSVGTSCGSDGDGRGSIRAVWKGAGLALLLACAAREARCQDPAGFNGGLDPAFRNVPLVWVVNAPNGSCTGVEIRYAFSASPPALYGCSQGTWTNLTAGGGGGGGGSGTVTSVATNNGLTGGTITTSGTLGLASIAAGGMLCNTGTTSQPPTVGNCGISVPESVTGTVAVSASAPLSLNATTGNLMCVSCLTANQTITLSGDASGSGATAIGVTNTGINGAAVGASWAVVGTNSGSQLVAATAHGTAAPLKCADTSGSGTAQSCNTSPSFTPAAGDAIIYQTTTANTGDVTTNVNSLGAKHIRKWLGSSTLAAGDLPANVPVSMVYDGTFWEIMTIGNAPSGGGGSGPCTTTANSLQYNSGGSFGCTAEWTYSSPAISTNSSGVLNLSASTSLTAFQVPTSGGYAPAANGALGFDSTQQRWAAGGNQSTTGYFPRLVYSYNATNDTGTPQLQCSTIGTTETAFDPGWTVPANFLIKGKILRIQIIYDFNTPVSESSMRVRIRWGGTSGTAVWDTGAQSQASIAEKGIFQEFLLQGTAAASGSASIEVGGGDRAADSLFPQNSIQSPVSVATNSSEALTLTLTCGAATASQNMTIRQMVIEELN
ncbi:MAG TPA: hypothetical protein VIY49_19070 [Bryobacteraceae bacterium]